MSETTIETYGDVYTYSFSPDASATMMVIFNNGSGGTGKQTADLTCERGGVYKFSGKVGEFSAVEKIGEAADAPAYTVNGLAVSASVPVTVYNAQGQVVAAGVSGSFELPAAGLYIISTGTTAAKHFVR